MRNLILRLAAVLTALCLMQVRVSADGRPPFRYGSVLMEAETGTVLGGTDSDVQLPCGTMTKLMTVYLTAKAISAGTLTEDTPVTAPPAAEAQKGAVIWLTAGEQMTVADLLRGIIIGNANDAAVTLACRLAGTEQAFVREMNRAAESLSMRNTVFTDCTGNDAGNLSSAHDLGLLCCALLQYDFLTPYFTTWRDFLREGETELVSENRLLKTYEGILGMKAGHGEQSGYTLALAAEKNGMRCAAVVLGCEDTDERFTYAKQLLHTGFTEYHVMTPDFSAEFLRPLPVRHGTETALLPLSGDLRAVAAQNGAALSCEILLPQYAEAPVTAGQPLGTAAFFCGDSLVFEVPLTASESVGKRDFRAALGMLLDILFK